MNEIWNKNSQPANTGRVWYVSGMSGVIKSSYPFGLGPLFSLLQADATIAIPPSVVISFFHREKEEREIGSEEICIKIEGSRTWISNRIFILSLKVP